MAQISLHSTFGFFYALQSAGGVPLVLGYSFVYVCYTGL